MHETLIPMRWADLDQLNHVNNVVYVDYAEQARSELVEAGEVSDGRVTAIAAEFGRPLLLSTTPVRVRTTVEGDTTAHDIAPDGASSTFATIRLGTASEQRTPFVAGGASFSTAVRRSDLGADGRVTATRFFEICQEARIIAFASIMPRREGHVVIARVDVRIGDPVTAQDGVVPSTTAVTHVGRSSYAVTTWFDEGRLGEATAVLVAFDVEAQRSRPLTEYELEVLRGVVVTP